MIRPENDGPEQRMGRDRGARSRSVVPLVDGTKVIIEFDARENPSRADQRCKLVMMPISVFSLHLFLQETGPGTIPKLLLLPLRNGGDNRMAAHKIAGERVLFLEQSTRCSALIAKAPTRKSHVRSERNTSQSTSS